MSFYQCSILYIMSKSSRKKIETSAKKGDSGQKSLRNSYDSKASQKKSAQWTQGFKYYLAASVGIVTFAVYLAAVHNEFAGWWDDSEYVYENPYIRSFSVDFLRWA